MSSSITRVSAIDMLRGIVMVLMLLDHVREFFFLHKQVSDPMLISAVEPALFFSRLSSHLCAPVFVFLTGMGAWLHRVRHQESATQSAKYLLKRGALFILLEITVVNFAWTFSALPKMVYLQVIWAIGVSLIALACCLWLPRMLQALIAFLLIAGHNLLSSISFGAGEPGFVMWAVLHDRSVIALGPDFAARTSYPVLPWIGVMLAGYVFAPLYAGKQTAEARRRVLTKAGGWLLLVFVTLRMINGYGDHPWSQEGSPLQIFMSFLNVTKYPPSLLFVLLTLGTAALLLAHLETRSPVAPLALLGRVPMFFYLAHLYLLHLLYLAFAWVAEVAPGERYGFDAVWQLWLLTPLTLFLLLPMCRWFADFKQKAGRSNLLRYL